MNHLVRNLWFKDTQQSPLFINNTAVRIRAGMLIIIPIYMLFTLLDVNYGSRWVVDATSVVDTYDTDFEGRIVYSINAVKRTFEYSFQTQLLLYALFEMLAGLFVFSSRLSPTIYLATWLAQKHPAHWKPLVPKRFAWVFGASMISVCLVFFNPDKVTGAINAVFGSHLPETYNYMPAWIPLVFVWVCLAFMWLEAIIGFCAGCQIHAFLVKLNLLSEACEECENIDWQALQARAEAEARQATLLKQTDPDQPSPSTHAVQTDKKDA